MNALLRSAISFTFSDFNRSSSSFYLANKLLKLHAIFYLQIQALDPKSLTHSLFKFNVHKEAKRQTGATRAS